jgi:hypothetical protein
MTRGYLGEFAFQKTLKDRWRIEAELGHEVGNLTEYLPLDIHQIRRDGEAARAPRLKISIKTTKWNGIWLDIPGDQFDHSDIHVLVKIGAGRDHLFGFFKSISVFRDKILLRGQEVGALSALEAGVLYDALPSFRPVSAYVSGFVRKDDNFENLPYGGRAGTKNFTVSSWNGPIRVGDLDAIKEQEGIRGTVRFAGIGEFSHDSGYLFNVGSLRWTEAQWREVIDAL